MIKPGNWRDRGCTANVGTALQSSYGRLSCLVLAEHLYHEIFPASKIAVCFPHPGTFPAAADPCCPLADPLSQDPVACNASQTTLQNPALLPEHLTQPHWCHNAVPALVSTCVVPHD